MSTETSLPDLSVIGCLCAGAVAGTSVDVTLHPIDTIKTRIQSQYGFVKAGGFSKIYSGLGSVLIGSAPGAALFFTSYESSKYALKHHVPQLPTAVNHLLAASMGEICACLVRVPTEVIKQRTQDRTSQTTRSSFTTARHLYASDGISGFYRGYRITVFREIPFAMIQFPLWESAKRMLSEYQGEPVNPVQAAACGSMAGVAAAACTTPLDLAKTRIMLAEKAHGYSRGKMGPVLYDVYEVDGVRGLFKGGATRSLWIGIGGFVFFGAFETARLMWLQQVHGADKVHVKHFGVVEGIEKLWKQFWAIGATESLERRPLTFEERIQQVEKAVEKGDIKRLTKWEIGLNAEEQKNKKS